MRKLDALHEIWYYNGMAKQRQRVFFIATKPKKEPAVVNFYTQKGERVAFRAVKRIKTREGVQFFTEADRARKP